MMMKVESEKCLLEFVRSRSEEAFRQVVGQHSGLVLGTAARRLGSDRSAAEDVMQEVFVLLAKKAGALVKGKVGVAPWLYRQTCRLSANRVRGEVRRRKREKGYGEGKENEFRNENEMTVEIDEALLSLNEEERELVMSRYVEERDYGEIGKRSGITSEAARKRVARAVEKLRGVLVKRGVTTSTSALAMILLGVSGPRASAALVAKVSLSSVKAGGSAAGTGGIFSIAGILAGAISLSAVVGGAKMLERDDAAETPSETLSQRVTRGGGSLLSQIQEGSAGGIEVSDEVIWEQLAALDSRPTNLVTDLMLKKILESVSGERFLEFMDGVDERFSHLLRQRVALLLIDRAVEHDAEGALEGLLDRGWFQIRDRSTIYDLGMQGVEQFVRQDLHGATAWLRENWAVLEGMKGRSTLSERPTTVRRGGMEVYQIRDRWSDLIVRSAAAVAYETHGFEGMKTLSSSFDDQGKGTVWRHVFFHVGGSSMERGDFYPAEFAEYMVTLPDHEPYGSVKDVSWERWHEIYNYARVAKGEEKLTKEQYKAILPENLAADFQRSSLDPIVPTEEGGAK